MNTITPSDIIKALSNCDPRQLASALASCPDPAFQQLADAVLHAAEIKATYPHDGVIAEADALLYDVLRWPMSDGIPANTSIGAIDYARIRGVSITEAEHAIQYVASTERLGCDQLLNSGVNPNFTLEQSQVLDCIVQLRKQGVVPNRGLVREHATQIAKDAIWHGEHPEPVIYSDDPRLAPRIASPSPKVHAILWLDRMDTNPPQVGLLDQRIAYLREAKAVMAAASSHTARLSATSNCSADSASVAHAAFPLSHVPPGLSLAG